MIRRIGLAVLLGLVLGNGVGAQDLGLLGVNSAQAAPVDPSKIASWPATLAITVRLKVTSSHERGAWQNWHPIWSLEQNMIGAFNTQERLVHGKIVEALPMRGFSVMPNTFKAKTERKASWMEENFATRYVVERDYTWTMSGVLHASELGFIQARIAWMTADDEEVSAFGHSHRVKISVVGMEPAKCP
jgi:hypothetical protein